MVADQQVATLIEGAAIVGEILSPHDFVFEPVAHGNGSGGPAAQGRFTRGRQSIDLHFRWSLGLVSYTWGDTVIGHAEYLRGLSLTGAYPGYGDDPLDGFRHLAEDLSGPLQGFVVGDRLSFDRQ